MEIIPWVVGAVIVLGLAVLALRALLRRGMEADSKAKFFDTRPELEKAFGELQATMARCTTTNTDRLNFSHCEAELASIRARSILDRGVNWTDEYLAALELLTFILTVDTEIVERETETRRAQDA